MRRTYFRIVYYGIKDSYPSWVDGKWHDTAEEAIKEAESRGYELVDRKTRVYEFKYKGVEESFTREEGKFLNKEGLKAELEEEYIGFAD